MREPSAADLKSAAAAPVSGRADIRFLEGDTEMARRIREFDWKSHPLGPPENWPQSLKIVIRIMLTSRFAMWLGWGREFYFFCNDAYLPTLGIKRDRALGVSARTVWAEIWPEVGPRAESVIKTGMATWDEGLQLFLERSGFREETYHTFSYSPVPDDDGSVGGMLCVVTEETERVVGERRLAALRDIAAELDGVRTEVQLFEVIGRLMSRHDRDIPFSLIYLFHGETGGARLASPAPGHYPPQFAPEEWRSEKSSSSWPARELLRELHLIQVQNLSSRFSVVPAGPWDIPPHTAVMVPLQHQGQESPAGFFVMGLNPYRPFDDSYRTFVELLAGQIAAALSNVRAYDAERRRAEALAEIDRAKTTFFSNISHELRTPLTLMLGPIEDELRNSAVRNETLELAHRNGLRLLKLVNTLLDFSRIEAGRIQPEFEATDLAAYTAELAGVFRSAIEKAGLRLTVDCPALDEEVYVDREMWEKIVLNLVSNAFKFTFEGQVRVSLRLNGDFAELLVADTGEGIPAAQLGRIFERFHRIRGSRSRSIEGTGIGLALVQELARLHGGEVEVRSSVGSGSTFTVKVRRGRNHLPTDRVSATARKPLASLAKSAFIDEGLRWLPPSTEEDEPFAANKVSQSRPAEKQRVLVADDNRDMRDYLKRLLSESFEVEVVEDGEKAFEEIQRSPPGLIISDVMMPRLDGFGLLRKIRENPRLRMIPLIMLSARAGEEARVEGLGAGADDYLVKPFSARELHARVSSQLALARSRREGEERLNNVLNSITDSFLLLDPEWRIAQLNSAALKILGQHLEHPEQIVGRSHWDVFPETLGTPVEQAYRFTAEQKLPSEFETFYRPWQRWFSLKTFPLPEGGISVFFRDITDRKELDRARDQLAAIVQCSSEAIISLNEFGRIITWNPAAETVFGYTSSEVIGRDLSFLVPENDHGTQADLLQRALDGEKIPRFHTRRRRKDGSLVDVSVKLDPVFNSDGEIVSIAGLVTDITEWKKAERLRAEQARLLDLSNDAIIVCEMDDRILYWNRGAEAIYGWPAREAVGMIKGDLLKTEYPGPLEEIQSSLTRKNRWEGELVQTCRDGRKIVVYSRWALDRDEQGNAVAILKTNNDITAWKEAEKALRSSEARFRNLANAMPQLVWSAEADGTVDYYNERIANYECAADDSGSWKWRTMLHPDELEGTLAAWDKATETGKTYQYEHRLKMRDGSWRWHLSRGIPVRDETGQIVKWFGTATDINDLKEAQLALVEARSSLEATVAQRTARLRESIAELEAFSYSVSHDMRAPLRAMKGFSRALIDDYSDKLDTEGRDLLGRIEKGANRLDLLVQDVLAYSRVAKGAFQLHPVDLEALARDVIQNFEFKSSRIDIRGPLPMVMAHEALVSQILSNLLGNAAKFARPDVPSRISLYAEEQGEMVRLWVEDNGIGIDPGHFSRIFEIFGRVHADQAYSGTGIGLSIVKKATERLGGEVGVESEPGKGSRFWVSFQKVV